MAKNTKGEQSKNKLIECAADMFLKNGYNSTGINDILAFTGLPKGSFYFHFESKKALAVEVSIYFDKKIKEWVLRTAEGKQWEEFITIFIGEMIKGAQEEKHFGCPFAVLGLEVSFSEPDIAKYYAKSLKELKDIFASILESSGIEKDKAAILSNRVSAVYEGYLVYYRISKDINVFKLMSKDLIDIYKSYREVEI